MTPNRGLIILTLAASLLTVTGGASSEADNKTKSGGFDIGDSDTDLIPYFISGGVMAALAVTQLSGGGDGENARQYDFVTGGRANAPALPFEGTTPPHWPLPGTEPPGWTRWGSDPPGWTISGADPPGHTKPSEEPPGWTMPGGEPPGQTMPREEYPGWSDEPAPDPNSVSNEVPEPGTLFLFGSSLLCVLGVRAIRRR